MMIIYGFILSFILVLVDQISKYVIFNTIGLNNPIPVIDNVFQLRGVFNTGAAFSILDEHSFILVIISIVAFLAITYFMKDCNFKRRPLYSIALILIYSGTIGNMIDRIFNSYKVFDFIEVLFMDFAIFNIADSYLTIGVILLAIYLLFFEAKDPISLKFNKEEVFGKKNKVEEEINE
ncbi:MAG: signal peptidase II [Bacilli bacterium]|nr:signal peptidase II [Bacilli bacterium]